MREVTFSAQDQRRFIADYLRLPETVERSDALRMTFDELIRYCLAAGELELGVALITLTAARSAGIQAEAAGALMGLVAAHRERRPDLSWVRTCRRCGCTDLDCTRCIERTGRPCTWVAEDLCSACVGGGGAS